jgi:hypothetical protein
MAQVVKHLPCKCETLTSNSKKKKKSERKEKRKKTKNLAATTTTNYKLIFYNRLNILKINSIMAFSLPHCPKFPLLPQSCYSFSPSTWHFLTSRSTFISNFLCPPHTKLIIISPFYS